MPDLHFPFWLVDRTTAAIQPRQVVHSLVAAFRKTGTKTTWPSDNKALYMAEQNIGKHNLPKSTSYLNKIITRQEAMFCIKQLCCSTNFWSLCTFDILARNTDWTWVGFLLAIFWLFLHSMQERLACGYGAVRHLWVYLGQGRGGHGSPCIQTDQVWHQQLSPHTYYRTLLSLC